MSGQISKPKPPSSFSENAEILLEDPITSPLEAWTQLSPPPEKMEQPIPGGIPPGGGYSSGAGAGDKLQQESDSQSSDSQPSNYQLPLDVLSVPSGNKPILGGPFSTLPNYGPQGSPNYVYNPLEAAGFSANWVSVGSVGSVPPVASSSSDSLSPLGEIESETKFDNSSRRPPSRRERWTDYYYTAEGRKVWTRAPHTYYRQKHSRDVCVAVAQRSHNGGKGASRAKVVSMIRAWYYCKRGA